MSLNNSNDTLKLKDFQEETVSHVVEMLKSKESHNRILVADEVGLGKTIIARGVINELFKKEKNKDTPYKVIYICSNQVIARQNMEKLDVSHSWNDNADECRLSMQSLLLLEDETENDYKGKVQLIPLTPSTSFAESGWATGIKEERAYIYAVLKVLGYANNEILKSLQVSVGKDNWKQLTTSRSDWKRFINNKPYDYSYVKRVKKLESKIKKVFDPYKFRIKKFIYRS